MAELNSYPQSSDKKVRAKKAALRVDLTAMVDLAFLLITFFMLTTTLSKPRAMKITMPVGQSSPVPQSRTMTICLGKDNHAVWYLGELAHPTIAATITNFSRDGLRREIAKARNKVRAETGKDIIVVIKPAETSVYDNLVNTIDEMSIGNIEQYAIAGIDKADIDMMKAKSVY